MDCSSVAPKTCVLKVNLHGPACEMKVHKLLRKINGVSSIVINGEHGKVTVSGNIDPCALIMALEKMGKKAELLWEDSAPINKPNQFSQASQHGECEGIDPKQMQQFSKIDGVKQVEITKCVKLTFKDHEDEVIRKCNTINIDIDDVHGPKMHHVYGSRGATSSCHAGSHGHATEKNGNCHFYGSAAHPTASGVHHENFNRCGSPRPHRRGPPEPSPASRHHHAPCPPQSPSFSYSYPGLFSDDNPHGCSLM